MANRVDSEAVKKVVTTDLTDLDVYIDLANAVVNNNLLNAGMSDDLLTKIETQLSGHFFTLLAEREAVMEKIGDAQVKYAENDSEGILSTRYGRAAVLLDTSGILSRLGGVKQTVEAI